MRFDCITSDLILLDSSISELSITNKNIDISDNIEKSLGLDIVPVEIGEEENHFWGKIILKIVIELKEEGEQMASIDMNLEGLFASPKPIEEERFKELVLVNGAAALYSVARGKVESISASVFSQGKITIPFVNILEFYKEKREED